MLWNWGGLQLASRPGLAHSCHIHRKPLRQLCVASACVTASLPQTSSSCWREKSSFRFLNLKILHHFEVYCLSVLLSSHSAHKKLDLIGPPALILITNWLFTVGFFEPLKSLYIGYILTLMPLFGPPCIMWNIWAPLCPIGKQNFNLQIYTTRLFADGRFQLLHETKPETFQLWKINTSWYKKWLKLNKIVININRLYTHQKT